ncbi:hypothetical protein Bca52824_052252 [Brassica carinata]|uniref:Uncharacterized protein n=1 Tax=Brassica carinata TaxID=52824 RepID=A0A8X7R3M8_BRACI|nr:hypothetical protein Bca52824_052252 [Brassica carinata]
MSFEVRLRWIGFWVPTLASCSIYRLRAYCAAGDGDWHKQVIWVGKWEDEIEDRKVEYMERKAEKNRKKQGAASTTNAGEGHVLKQRRLYMCTRDNVELSMDKKGEVDNLQEIIAAVEEEDMTVAIEGMLPIVAASNEEE